MISTGDIREFLTILAAQAKAALANVDRPGVLQIVRLHPSDEVLIPTRYRFDDTEIMINAAVNDSVAGHNVYVEGRTVHAGLRGKARGTEKDTCAVFALVVDSDADKKMGWIPTVQLSMTVETSPGNFQYWFFLREAIDCKTAKRLGERIRRATKCDHDTGNPVQPYRVAGTINYPNKVKLARGRVIAPTHLIEFDPETLWTPETIEAAFPIAEPPAENGADGDAAPVELDESDVPGETLRVIRDGVGADEDRSHVFFNVVLALKRNGWTIAGIVALLERYPNGIAQKYRGRLEHEVKRSYGKVKIKDPQPAAEDEPPEAPPSAPPVAPDPGLSSASPASAIEDTLTTFEKWLILPSRTPLYAILGVVAANLLPGDPVWIGLVAPPSSAKTELLNAFAKLPFVVSASTLTLAGLLSGTPRRQQTLGAKGGLLRQIGNPGILCLKDFTSILTMRPDSKAEVLAALREIYDGRWTRYVGADGGRPLHWEGKIGLIFGCTGIIDVHYSVSDALGNRFLLSRLEPEKTQFRKALEHTGSSIAAMRRELAASVAALFAVPRSDPQALNDVEFDRLNRVVSLVVRLRGAVERDRHSREIEAIYGAQGTGRIGLSLERLLAGLDTLGVDRTIAMDVVETIAMDSVPPLRRRAYELLQAGKKNNPPIASMTTPAIAGVLGLPTNTVRRTLEDLAAYKLINRMPQGAGKPDLWAVA